MPRGISVSTNEPYVSMKDAAAHFGVSEVTIRRWIAKRKIPAYKIGRTVRCRISELEKALEPVGKGS